MMNIWFAAIIAIVVLGALQFWVTIAAVKVVSRRFDEWTHMIGESHFILIATVVFTACSNTVVFMGIVIWSLVLFGAVG